MYRETDRANQTYSGGMFRDHNHTFGGAGGGDNSDDSLPDGRDSERHCVTHEGVFQHNCFDLSTDDLGGPLRRSSSCGAALDEVEGSSSCSSIPADNVDTNVNSNPLSPKTLLTADPESSSHENRNGAGGPEGGATTTSGKENGSASKSASKSSAGTTSVSGSSSTTTTSKTPPATTTTTTTQSNKTTVAQHAAMTAQNKNTTGTGASTTTTATASATTRTASEPPALQNAACYSADDYHVFYQMGADAAFRDHGMNNANVTCPAGFYYAQNNDFSFSGPSSCSGESVGGGDLHRDYTGSSCEDGAGSSSTCNSKRQQGDHHGGAPGTNNQHMNQNCAASASTHSITTTATLNNNQGRGSGSTGGGNNNIASQYPQQIYSGKYRTMTSRPRLPVRRPFRHPPGLRTPGRDGSTSSSDSERDEAQYIHSCPTQPLRQNNLPIQLFPGSSLSGILHSGYYGGYGDCDTFDAPGRVEKSGGDDRVDGSEENNYSMISQLPRKAVPGEYPKLFDEKGEMINYAVGSSGSSSTTAPSANKQVDVKNDPTTSGTSLNKTPGTSSNKQTTSTTSASGAATTAAASGGGAVGATTAPMGLKSTAGTSSSKEPVSPDNSSSKSLSGQRIRFPSVKRRVDDQDQREKQPENKPTTSTATSDIKNCFSHREQTFHSPEQTKNVNKSNTATGGGATNKMTIGGGGGQQQQHQLPTSCTMKSIMNKNTQEQHTSTSSHALHRSHTDESCDDNHVGTPKHTFMAIDTYDSNFDSPNPLQQEVLQQHDDYISCSNFNKHADNNFNNLGSLNLKSNLADGAASSGAGQFSGPISSCSSSTTNQQMNNNINRQNLQSNSSSSFMVSASDAATPGGASTSFLTISQPHSTPGVQHSPPAGQQQPGFNVNRQGIATGGGQLQESTQSSRGQGHQPASTTSQQTTVTKQESSSTAPSPNDPMSLYAKAIELFPENAVIYAKARMLCKNNKSLWAQQEMENFMELVAKVHEIPATCSTAPPGAGNNMVDHQHEGGTTPASCSGVGAGSSSSGAPLAGGSSSRVQLDQYQSEHHPGGQQLYGLQQRSLTGSTAGPSSSPYNQQQTTPSSSYGNYMESMQVLQQQGIMNNHGAAAAASRGPHQYDLRAVQEWYYQQQQQQGLVEPGAAPGTTPLAHLVDWPQVHAFLAAWGHGPAEIAQILAELLESMHWWEQQGGFPQELGRAPTAGQLAAAGARMAAAYGSTNPPGGSSSSSFGLPGALMSGQSSSSSGRYHAPPATNRRKVLSRQEMQHLYEMLQQSSAIADVASGKDIDTVDVRSGGAAVPAGQQNNSLRSSTRGNSSTALDPPPRQMNAPGAAGASSSTSAAGGFVPPSRSFQEDQDNHMLEALKTVADSLKKNSNRNSTADSNGNQHRGGGEQQQPHSTLADQHREHVSQAAGGSSKNMGAAALPSNRASTSSCVNNKPGALPASLSSVANASRFKFSSSTNTGNNSTHNSTSRSSTFGNDGRHHPSNSSILLDQPGGHLHNRSIDRLYDRYEDQRSKNSSRAARTVMEAMDSLNSFNNTLDDEDLEDENGDRVLRSSNLRDMSRNTNTLMSHNSSASFRGMTTGPSNNNTRNNNTGATSNSRNQGIHPEAMARMLNSIQSTHTMPTTRESGSINNNNIHASPNMKPGSLSGNKNNTTNSSSSAGSSSSTSQGTASAGVEAATGNINPAGENTSGAAAGEASTKTNQTETEPNNSMLHDFKPKYKTDKEAQEGLKREYSKSKQMAIFHYTLRNAKKQAVENGLPLEYNFHLIEMERQRKEYMKNANSKSKYAALGGGPSSQSGGGPPPHMMMPGGPPGPYPPVHGPTSSGGGAAPGAVTRQQPHPGYGGAGGNYGHGYDDRYLPMGGMYQGR
ncbi:unnamed protein product [Amoebophrya sp. A120]|nr:unnamed protein product [Amoebophrya sp. A120]|eukprot:GSA120T00013983001.1